MLALPCPVLPYERILAYALVLFPSENGARMPFPRLSLAWKVCPQTFPKCSCPGPLPRLLSAAAPHTPGRAGSYTS